LGECSNLRSGMARKSNRGHGRNKGLKLIDEVMNVTMTGEVDESSKIGGGNARLEKLIRN
jgi:hypothetical protein